MKNAAGILLGLSALALAACSGPAAPEPATPAAEAAPADGLTMDAETQTKMGVASEPIASSNAPRTVQGFARVLDVGPLAAIESEVGAAVATAASSQEEYRRLAALAQQDQAASARSVEAASAQAASDAARAKLAGQRIGLEWGPALERMADRDRARLLTDISAGRAALLRIDAPDATSTPAQASIQQDKGAPPIPVTLLGPAATADVRLQTKGLLGVVRGAAAASLPTGQMLQANLELGATEQGYLIPASALVRADDGVLVYLKTGADTFIRKPLGSGHPVPEGWFVTEGFSPGDQVVTHGAASLLAAEAGPVEAE